MSREYLNRGFSDKLVQAYYEYMVDIATLLGADRARAEVELKESLQFEMKLANVSHRDVHVTNLYLISIYVNLGENDTNIRYLFLQNSTKDYD